MSIKWVPALQLPSEKRVSQIPIQEPYYKSFAFALIAQLVEHETLNFGVAGSSPAGGTMPKMAIV